MTFGSLFSGCGLMDLGLEQAGLECRWQCEIDRDARRVLAHHWQGNPCHEDVRQVGKHNLEPVDVIAGGFPCQDLSVAGQRAGIQAGIRSGLWWEMLRVIGELQPRVVLWENVPGLSSSDGGRDFRRVCSSLAERGYLGCVRTLDARYFGVPQRRRRLFGVFVRDDPTAGRAAQILAFTESRSRNPPQSGEAESDVAGTLTGGASGTSSHGKKSGTETLRSRQHRPSVNPPGRGGEDDQNLVTAFNPIGGTRSLDAGGLSPPLRVGTGIGIPSSPAIIAHALSIRTGNRNDPNGQDFITHTLASNGADASEDGTGRGTPIVAFKESQSGTRESDCHATLDANKGSRRQEGVRQGMMVRRLTPTECLRLMGAPDSWLDLDPPLSDSAKYRLCGNGVVVPVARWLGRRMLSAETQRTGGSR